MSHFISRIECLYDGDDCNDEDAVTGSKGSEAYHKSVDYMNFIFDLKFNTTTTDRTWLPHIPTFVDKQVIKQIESEFEIEMKITSRSGISVIGHL